MQLKDIANELLQKKYFGSPRRMAKEFDMSEMDIRRIAGIDPGSRRNQEKIFQFILKLLPVCDELGIDPAQNLPLPIEGEVIQRVKTAREGISSDAKGGTDGAQKGRAGSFSPRRIAGASGKSR